MITIGTAVKVLIVVFVGYAFFCSWLHSNYGS